MWCELLRAKRGPIRITLGYQSLSFSNSSNAWGFAKNYSLAVSLKKGHYFARSVKSHLTFLQAWKDLIRSVLKIPSQSCCFHYTQQIKQLSISHDVAFHPYQALWT